MGEQPGQDGYEQYYLQVNPPDQANYRRKARGYERRFGRLLSRESIRSCLDLGCATGMFTSYLCSRGYQDVVGVDLNEALVEVARGNVQAQFVVDDALHYVATCGRSFDAVFLLDLLEHLQRDRIVHFLTDVRGCLNDGGFALVRVPNMNSLLAAGKFYGDWTHVTPFTERSLYHMAKLAGFARTEMCGQFRMQNFKGKIKACINSVIVPTLLWLRGGHKVKVYYSNLIAKLSK